MRKLDVVKIISGYYKGKTGKVIRVYPKNKKVQIGNIGFHKKHLKPRVSKKHPNGGVIKIPKLIHISNIALC